MTDSNDYQTKDFVKFLSLVVILYLGTVSVPQPQEGSLLTFSRVLDDVYIIGTGSNVGAPFLYY